MRYFILSVTLIIGVLVSFTIAQGTDTTHQEASLLPHFSMGFYLVPYKSQTVFEPQLSSGYSLPILEKNLPSPEWYFQYDFGPTQERALFAGGDFEFRVWRHLYLQGSLQLLNRSTQVTEEILDYDAGDDTTYIRSRKFTSNITLIMPQIGLKYYFKHQIPRHVALKTYSHLLEYWDTHVFLREGAMTLRWLFFVLWLPFLVIGKDIPLEVLNPPTQTELLTPINGPQAVHWPDSPIPAPKYSPHLTRITPDTVLLTWGDGRTVKISQNWKISSQPVMGGATQLSLLREKNNYTISGLTVRHYNLQESTPSVVPIIPA